MRKEYLRVVRGSSRAGAGEQVDCLSLLLYSGEIAGILPLDFGGLRTLKLFLTGVRSLDSGGLYLRGRRCTSEVLCEQLQREVILIDEDTNLIRTLSLTANLFGRDIRPLLVNHQAEMEKLRRLTEVFGVDLPAAIPVEHLSLLQRCQAEVLQGVLAGKTAFFLDLRNLSIAEDDYQELMRLMQLLRDRGRTVILMDYRRENLVPYAESITVLRNAGTVRMLEQRPFDLGFQKRGEQGMHEKTLLESAGDMKSEVLRLKRLGGSFLETSSLTVRRGELVSVIYKSRKEADELCRILTGEEPFSGKYALCGHGMHTGRFDRMDATDRGLCVVDGTDAEEQVFWNLNIYENVCMARGRRVTTLWRSPNHQRHVRQMIDREFGTPGSWKRRAEDCTAEEVRRVILLRWLLFRPAVLLLRDPFLATGDAVQKLTEHYIGEFLRRKTAVLILAEKQWEWERTGHTTYILDGTIRLYEDSSAD